MGGTVKHSRIPFLVALALAGLPVGHASAQGTESKSSEQATERAAALKIGNPAAGEKDFAICRACHQVGPNAQNGVGPVLNGVIGRKVASYPGYEYSSALKNSNIGIWTVPKLQEWLAGPQKMVPGTKMIFPGFTDKSQINNVIAYLAQFNDKGQKTNPG
jgi:cytochrome c